MRDIPCRVLYKQCTTNKRRTNPLRFGFKVEYVGKGQYFGFEVDQDHRYLLDDFTVTHNSGKTNIMISILKCMPPKTYSMVLVDTIDLAIQNFNEIKKFGFTDVGIFYGEVKEPNYITVVLINSAYKLAEYYKKIRVLVGDEIHASMAPRNLNLYKQLVNAEVRIGFSATPFKNDGKDLIHKHLVKGHIGPVLMTNTIDGGKLTTAALQERDILSSVKCKFYKINEPQRQFDIYNDAITFGLAQNEFLNTAVARLTKSLHGRTLVVVSRIEHGERLIELIPGAFWLHGSQKKDIREATISGLKYDKGDFVGVAVNTLVNKGLNFFIHNLINVAGGRAEHQTIQLLGRGLRTAADKEILNYFDFYFKINPYLQKHSEERMRVLTAEGHKIEVKESFDF